MNADEVAAMFTFAEDRPLQVTLRNPQGKAWATDMPCKPPYVSEQYEQPEEGPAIVRIADQTGQNYYTDFPVEKVDKNEQGNLVLTGPKGTATFQVGGTV